MTKLTNDYRIIIIIMACVFEVTDLIFNKVANCIDSVSMSYIFLVSTVLPKAFTFNYLVAVVPLFLHLVSHSPSMSSIHSKTEI